MVQVFFPFTTKISIVPDLTISLPQLNGGTQLHGLKLWEFNFITCTKKIIRAYMLHHHGAYIGKNFSNIILYTGQEPTILISATNESWLCVKHPACRKAVRNNVHATAKLLMKARYIYACMPQIGFQLLWSWSQILE